MSDCQEEIDIIVFAFGKKADSLLSHPSWNKTPYSSPRHPVAHPPFSTWVNRFSTSFSEHTHEWFCPSLVSFPSLYSSGFSLFAASILALGTLRGVFYFTFYLAMTLPHTCRLNLALFNWRSKIWVDFCTPVAYQELIMGCTPNLTWVRAVAFSTSGIYGDYVCVWKSGSSISVVFSHQESFGFSWWRAPLDKATNGIKEFSLSNKNPRVFLFSNRSCKR